MSSTTDSSTHDRGVSTVIGVAIMVTLTIGLAVGVMAYTFGFVSSGADEPKNMQTDVVVDDEGHVVIQHTSGEKVAPGRLKVTVRIQNSDGEDITGTVSHLPSQEPQLESSDTKGEMKFDTRYGAVSPAVLSGKVESGERIAFNVNSTIDPKDTVVVKIIDTKANTILDKETIVPENTAAGAALPSKYFDSAAYSSSSETYVSDTLTKYSKTSPGEEWEKNGVNSYDRVIDGYYYTESRYDPGTGWYRSGVDHYETYQSGWMYTTSASDPGAGWEKVGVDHYETYQTGWTYRWFDTYSALTSNGYSLVTMNTYTYTKTVWDYGWYTTTYTETHTEFVILDREWHSGYWTKDVEWECNEFFGWGDTADGDGSYAECHKTVDWEWHSGWWEYDYGYRTITHTHTEWEYGWHQETVTRSDTIYYGKKATYDSYAVYDWRKPTYDTYAVYDWKKPYYKWVPVYEWQKTVYGETANTLAYNGDSSYTVASDVKEMKDGDLTIKDDKLAGLSDAFTVTADGKSGSQTLTVAESSTGGIKVVDDGQTVWKGQAEKVAIDLKQDQLVIHKTSGTTTKSVDFEIGPDTDETIGTYTLTVDSGDNASGSYDFVVDGDTKV